MPDEQTTSERSAAQAPRASVTREPIFADEEPAPGFEPEWAEQEPDELPPRPRRRLLAPVPVALAAVLMTAAGFIGGVLVEKGQGGSTATSSAAGLAGRLSALRSGAGAGAAGAGIGAGAGGGAGAGAAGATAGQVAFVQGNTMYVTDGQGNTVKVTVTSATSISKSTKAAAGSIHPGETVVVSGSPAAGGAIDAETIRAGETGGGGGLAALLGGGGGGGRGASPGAAGSSGAGGGGGGEASLFGKGG